MVNTLKNGLDTPRAGAESASHKPYASGLLRNVSATVLASSLAALLPTAAQAQGYVDARIDDEEKIQLTSVQGTGFEAKADVSDDARKVTVTGGPAGSEVIVGVACTPGKDYELKVTDTRLEYRIDQPTNEEKATHNVSHVHVKMAATGQNYMTMECDNNDGDNKELVFVFLNDPKAQLTGSQTAGGSDSFFDGLGKTIHMGVTPALSVEGITGDGVALGLGGFVHGAYQVANYVDVGARLGALAQPIDANDVNRDGTPTGTIYKTYSPLLFAGIECGLGNDDIRLAPGLGIAYAAGHNVDGYKKIESETDPVASLALSAFVGEAGKAQLELTVGAFSDFTHDATTVLPYIGIGIAK